VGPRGDSILEETVLSSVRKRERVDTTLLLSMSSTSEYFSLVYTLMRFIIGHVSINIISAVLTNVLMFKKMYPLGILGIFIRT
jgi:hypothetical protein